MIDQLLWFLYLIFLIAAIGPNITYAFWIQRAFVSNRESLPFTLRTVMSINNTVVLPAIALASITWVAMVYLSGQNMGIPWILLTGVFWLVIFLLGLFGYRPALRRQIELAEGAGPDSEDYNSAAWRSMVLGIAIGILALMILLLLAFTPPLWG